jgi:hypothetical protein
MKKTISQRIFARIMDKSDDPCSGISKQACEAVAGNFFLTIGANFLTRLGDEIASPKITLAWIMGAVGAPAYLLGLLVPIRESGSLLPQLLIAGFIGRLPLRKYVWVAGSLVQAVAIGGIGLTAMFLEGPLAGWLIILLLVLFSVARGFSSISSKDVLGKTIPRAQRGQTTGWGLGCQCGRFGGAGDRYLSGTGYRCRGGCRFLWFARARCCGAMGRWRGRLCVC